MQCDEDFIAHKTARPEDIVRYNAGDGNGPNPEDLHFDMRSGPESPWNTEVMEILLEKLKKKKQTENWSLPEQPDAYFRTLLQDKYKRARERWKTAQPRITDMNVPETSEQVEKRMAAKKEITLKDSRMLKRRSDVSRYVTMVTFPLLIIDEEIRSSRKDRDDDG